MNYGQLKTLIDSLSHRSDLSGLYDNFTELVEAEIGRKLRTSENEYTEDVTTTAEAYALSGLTKTFGSMRNIYAQISGKRRPLPLYSKAQLDVLTSGVSYTPVGYCLQAGSIEVRPTNGNQTLTLTYWHKPTTLVGADGNTNDELTAFPQLYVQGLLAEVKAYEEDTEGEAKHRAKFDNYIMQLNEEAEAERYSGGQLAGIDGGLA